MVSLKPSQMREHLDEGKTFFEEGKYTGNDYWFIP